MRSALLPVLALLALSSCRQTTAPDPTLECGPVQRMALQPFTDARLPLLRAFTVMREGDSLVVAFQSHPRIPSAHPVFDPLDESGWSFALHLGGDAFDRSALPQSAADFALIAEVSEHNWRQTWTGRIETNGNASRFRMALPLSAVGQPTRWQIEAYTNGDRISGRIDVYDGPVASTDAPGGPIAERDEY